VERSGISEIPNSVDEDVIREFKRRVEKKLKGQEPLDKSLAFYNILESLQHHGKTPGNILSELDVHTEQCVDNNMNFLEKSGYIEKGEELYRLSAFGRKLFIKSK